MMEANMSPTGQLVVLRQKYGVALRLIEAEMRLRAFAGELSACCADEDAYTHGSLLDDIREKRQLFNAICGADLTRAEPTP